MKNILLLAMQFLSIIPLAAQAEGPHNPASFSNISIPGYNQQWTNISNAAVSDMDYASFGNLSGGAGSHTDYLAASNFGFDIPDGTSITGIKVEVECSDPNARTSDYSVRLMQKGIVTGDDKAIGTAYTVSDDYMVYGDDKDLWGSAWTYKDVNDTQFGVAVAAQRTLDDTNIVTAGRINSIRITVYFSYSTLPATLTSFTAIKAGNKVKLSWKTASENNMLLYEVERSANAVHFTSIIAVPSQNVPQSEYSHVDHNPIKGVSYYRLAMKELTGEQKYSQVIAVSLAKNTDIFLYPSPWKKGTTLNVSTMNSEKLTIYFMNATGQILSTVVTDSGLVSTVTLVNRKGLVYYKILDGAKNELATGSLLVL